MDDEWRWYGRKTSSHNTVVVDNKDQFVVDSQRFGLPKIATSTVHTFESKDLIDFIHASHNGYETLDQPVTHHRKIYLDKTERCWILTDVLVGGGRHQFDWYFHFNDEIDCDILDELCILAKHKDGIKLELKPLETDNLYLEMIEGWISEKYGEKTKAKVARYYTKRDCPIELTFQISYC